MTISLRIKASGVVAFKSSTCHEMRYLTLSIEGSVISDARLMPSLPYVHIKTSRIIILILFYCSKNRENVEQQFYSRGAFRQIDDIDGFD